MKKILILFLFSLYGNSLLSQDKLFKADSTKLDVNILELNSKEVKYKLFNKPDGPTYIISKSDIVLIIYKNGDRETFSVPKQQVPPNANPSNNYNQQSKYEQKQERKEKRFAEITKTKNAILFNFTQLIIHNVGFDYIHEFYHSSIQLHIPISAAYGSTDFYSTLEWFTPDGLQSYGRTQKAFDVGVGIYLNTSGKRAFTHFIGPLFRFVQFNGTYEVYSRNTVYGSASSPNSLDTYGFVLNQTCAMLNNGFLYRITPHLNAMISLAFGVVTSRKYVVNDPYKILSNPTNSANRNTAVGRLSFSFGYRF